MSKNTNPSQSGRTISFWDQSGLLKPLLDQAADVHNIKTSELIYEILIDKIDEYMDVSEFSEEKQEWLNRQKQAQKEKYTMANSKELKKENTFINWMSSEIYDQFRKGATEDEVKEWLKKNKPLFENRDELEHYKAMRTAPHAYEKKYNDYHNSYENVNFDIPNPEQILEHAD